MAADVYRVVSRLRTSVVRAHARNIVITRDLFQLSLRFTCGQRAHVRAPKRFPCRLIGELGKHRIANQDPLRLSSSSAEYPLSAIPGCDPMRLQLQSASGQSGWSSRYPYLYRFLCANLCFEKLGETTERGSTRRAPLRRKLRT